MTQQIKLIKLPSNVLIRRLLDFYKNELVVRIILDLIRTKGGYDNKGGLVITYINSEDKYLVVTSNDKYDYLVSKRGGLS